MTIVETILLRAFLSFLLLGCIAGLALGTMLILRPRWVGRLSLVANRWISTRHIDKFLETSINIDSWFYRYRFISGSVTLAGAVYILYFYSVHIDKASVVSGLAMRFRLPAAYINVLYDPMVMIAILGSVFALLASLFVLLLPGIFHKFEHSANKWVSLRRTMKPLEIVRNNLDEFTFRNTLPIGMMLVLGSVYTLVLLIYWAR